jgi:hypothetical protein
MQQERGPGRLNDRRVCLCRMKVHLVNPSDVSFGTAVIIPRWLYVLAAATPRSYGDPLIIDETLDQVDPATIRPGE